MCSSEYASKQLKKIQNRISEAALSANRLASEISLIGAAKHQDAQLVKCFMQAGLKDIGENYLQQAIDKKSIFSASQNSCVSQSTWHYIGKIQSNKTNLIAQNFDWVHCVDRLKIATRLANQRQQMRVKSRLSYAPLNLLIQLNIDDENSKGGIALSQAMDLSAQIAQLEGVRLRGFMLIPKARADFTTQRAPFAKARELLTQVNQHQGLQLDTLSMGMSGDLEAAIIEGATMVRIGTDLFGPRPST